MDEVENPALPAAGEASPTLRPVIEDDGPNYIISGPPASNIQSTTLDGIQFAADQNSRGGFQSSRPPLRRDGSAPPPEHAPPPPPLPPPLSASDDNPDSLTLADLKRLRSGFPTNNQAPAHNDQLLDCDGVYDFTYQDAQSLPAELEEWFSYSEEEQARLRQCRTAFAEAWHASPEGSRSTWLDVTEDARRAFVRARCEQLAKDNQPGDGSTEALMALTYIGLGVWEETACREEGCALDVLFPDTPVSGGSRLEEYTASRLQVQWIVGMVDTLHSCGGLEIVYRFLRETIDDDFRMSIGDPNLRSETPPRRPDESVELWCCLTLMYLFIEVARCASGEQAQRLRTDVVALEPNLLNYLTEVVAKMRWDENAPIPLTKMLLLAWKSILVCIGGIKDVEVVKQSLKKKDDEKDARGQPVITASPLEYHLFRQEISSKYPAYQPPPPLFPLEPENNSILPPLKHRRASYASTDSSFPFTRAPNVGAQSIMHQPVHIATPAPSPPPSPGGPGKAGKKQNYQTNQMFPFLYPPLDMDSNDLGGKGSTELQDTLVGRKWHGSDIPTSILEAAELFAKRMRATRAMEQLWEARVDYMKHERGWKASSGVDPEFDEFDIIESVAPDETATQGEPLAQTPEQKRLAAVSKYYQDSLPHLQSVVIVLLKVVLQNVTDLVTKRNGQNGLQAGIQFNDPNALGPPAKPLENGTLANGDVIENTAEEVDKLRTQEIAAKALSAILLLLLKWFKVSHILQYEYMTQLLLDSNYVPLILKSWQTQEVGRACHYRLENPELNFFNFCRESSRQISPVAANKDDMAEQSDDDAVPPPIKLRRGDTAHPLSPSSPLEFGHPPEVDELGYPQTPLPSSPLKNYSYRNVFVAINYLRILQKITRRKTHRALLLVSYKSSNHLRKTLKIPIRLLRYYTLKLYKSQVPFCGRKWRQGNMKIITAVWLSVPAELRDDWLSGGGGGMGGVCVGDVDGTVEDALPLEQSLRHLTHWWNVRHFPEVMGVDKGLLEEEADFFVRELEKMDFVGHETHEGELAEEGGMEAEGWQGPIDGY